jgi:hypothetical protein
MNLQEIINELKEIANDAGDNMDRGGEYTSDRIREIIRKLED